MGKTLDFLMSDWIVRRYGTAEWQSLGDAALAAKYPPETEKQMRAMFRGPMLQNGHIASPNRSMGAEEVLRRAALQWVQGGDAAAVRRLFHGLAERWIPIVSAMDFTPRKMVYEELTPVMAKELIKESGGTISKRGNLCTVRCEVLPQPLDDDIEKVLMAAAISGDRELSRELARKYPVPKIVPGATTHSEIRFRALRHILAEDSKGIAEAVKNLADGYPVDFPPERIEFPIGVACGDVKRLINGMKSINTRFRGIWNPKRVQDWYDKRQARLAERGRAMLPFEKVLDGERSNLVGLRWLLSTWALAFLNIARWHGMKSPFDMPKLFSEWIPLELCT